MADIEKKNNQSLDVLFTPEEYKELLLQAVAVIESARCRLARQAAATTNDTYWEIGKLLYDRKLESKPKSHIKPYTVTNSVPIYYTVSRSPG